MVLLMIIAVLLVVIVMAQNPKGGGLSSTFGGASSAQFGVQRTNDFMEKSTWVLAITACVLIILTVVMTADPTTITKVPTKPSTSQQKNIPQQNNIPTQQQDNNTQQNTPKK